MVFKVSSRINLVFVSNMNESQILTAFSMNNLQGNDERLYIEKL